MRRRSSLWHHRGTRVAAMTLCDDSELSVWRVKPYPDLSIIRCTAGVVQRASVVCCAFRDLVDTICAVTHALFDNTHRQPSAGNWPAEHAKSCTTNNTQCHPCALPSCRRQIIDLVKHHCRCTHKL